MRRVRRGVWYIPEVSDETRLDIHRLQRRRDELTKPKLVRNDTKRKYKTSFKSRFFIFWIVYKIRRPRKSIIIGRSMRFGKHCRNRAIIWLQHEGDADRKCDCNGIAGQLLWKNHVTSMATINDYAFWNIQAPQRLKLTIANRTIAIEELIQISPICIGYKRVRMDS